MSCMSTAACSCVVQAGRTLVKLQVQQFVTERHS